MGGHMSMGGGRGHQMGGGGVGVIAKVNKMMKQAAFQFSYDPINKRFSRELRDKENKDIMIDRNYLQLKVLKEQWQAKLQAQSEGADPALGKIPARLGHITYLDYLNRVQNWQASGGNMELQAYLEREDDENEDQESEDSDHNEEKKIAPTPLMQPKQMSLGANKAR